MNHASLVQVFFIFAILFMFGCSGDEDKTPTTSTSRAEFSLYDDFSLSGGIDGGNWFSGENTTTVSGGALSMTTTVDQTLAGTNYTDSLFAVA